MAANDETTTDDIAPQAGSTPVANRARFSIAEICAAASGEIIAPGGISPQTEIIGVISDSRVLPAGALFVALKGEKFDGHEYLKSAREKGAIAALVEKNSVAQITDPPAGLLLIAVRNTLTALGELARAHRKKFPVPLVAVTGSYGKTTTRAMIAAALSPKYNVLSAAGNFNNEIGVPQTLLQLDETHGAAVLEFGMRGVGQIEYLAQIALPDVGVITNIGPQHIELLGSVENIAAAKSEVLQFLPETGAAILPADDEYLDFFTDQVRAAQIVRFGTNPSAEYQIGASKTGESGHVTFTIHDPNSKSQNVQLPMPGEHNALNAAAALAVAGVLGVPLSDAAHALENVQVPGARMRVVHSETRGLTIIDDCYNAGPNSMRAALETLRAWKLQPKESQNAGRRVAILGAMKELGDHAEAEHRAIGALAAQCAEVVIGVGEETRILIETAEAVGAIPFQTHWFEDAKSAAVKAQTLVREGDLVLVKGSRSVGLELVVNALAGDSQ
jgi:UDP-N-acetylmuramoyl-tripeptide--D-alanyl-D-alanine ligase